jgi:hypothetical protein
VRRSEQAVAIIGREGGVVSKRYWVRATLVAWNDGL